MLHKKSIFSLIFVAVVATLLFQLCSEKKNSRKGETTPPLDRNTVTATQNDTSHEGSETTIATTVQNDTLSGSGKQEPTEKKKVVALSGLDTVTTIVEGTPGQLLVFDLYADWCRPCKILAPMYDSLAATHGHQANFYRVDVQRNPDIAAAFGVRGIPLVVFMKDQKVVQAITGLNPRKSYERILTSCGPSVSLEECRKNLSKPL